MLVKEVREQVVDDISFRAAVFTVIEKERISWVPSCIRDTTQNLEGLLLGNVVMVRDLFGIEWIAFDGATVGGLDGPTQRENTELHNQEGDEEVPRHE